MGSFLSEILSEAVQERIIYEGWNFVNDLRVKAVIYERYRS